MRLNIVNVSVPKITYEFNVILTKISAGFFFKNYKMILEFIWNYVKIRVTKKFLLKKD